MRIQNTIVPGSMRSVAQDVVTFPDAIGHRTLDRGFVAGTPFLFTYAIIDAAANSAPGPRIEVWLRFWHFFSPQPLFFSKS